MRLLDLIELHQYGHSHAQLWLFRVGPYIGQTSLVSTPGCFAITIKDPRLTVRILERLISEYRESGCLKTGSSINGEAFLPLLVDVDEFGMFHADCMRPDQIHG